MSKSEFENDDLGKDVERYLKNPNEFSPGPPEASIKRRSDFDSDICKRYTLVHARLLLERSRNVDSARKLTINYAEGLGATSEEAEEFMQSIGLVRMDSKERINALKDAAKSFLESRTLSEEFERAMELYAPTVENILQVMDEKLNGDKEQKPPPLNFFKKKFRRSK